MNRVCLSSVVSLCNVKLFLTQIDRLDEIM